MTLKLIPRKFYSRDTVTVAKELLGKQLVRRIGKQTISGIITETEAYKHKEDPASHAYNGITERNKAMFGEVGRAYVYFTYGMYYCVNAVARDQNSEAGAVLIRAIKPLKGIEEMIKNRKNKAVKDLTNGPAKLTQALYIDKKQYGIDLSKRSELFVSEGIEEKIQVVTSERIGISKAVNKKWNFKIQI